MESCCARCVEENCAVAVFSGPGDHPPRACWIKSAVEVRSPAREPFREPLREP